MSKPPLLHLVVGKLTQEESKVYRLRETHPQEAPEEEPWPKAGEWRDLVRRLMRNPVKGK